MSNSNSSRPDRELTTALEVTASRATASRAMASEVMAEEAMAMEEMAGPATEATGLLRLSPQQRTAIEWLTAGETAATAAAAAGVNPRTVSRWMSCNPEFLAAYNAWQADVLATAQARIVAATGVALTAVVNAMARGDAKTGMAFLSKLGLLKTPRPGPTDLKNVKMSQRAARERETMRLFYEQEDAINGREPK